MGSKAPDPPDYSGIAAAASKNADLTYQAAMDANQTAKDQLAWAKQTYNDEKPVTDQIVAQALADSKAQAENAAADRARYQAVYQPLEDKAVADANDYASPGRLQQQMGAAEATTQEQVNAARDASLASLQSYGVKPGAPKYLGADIAARTAGGAATAAAGTTAAINTENTGRALREEAINVGKGYPAQITGSYAGATSAGASGNTSMNQTFQQGSSAMGTPTQWGSLGVSNANASSNALSVWGNALNEGYQNALSSSQQSTGVGSLLGLAGSLAMAPVTGGGSVFGHMLGMATGGMVPETNAPAVGGYASGGTVQGFAAGGAPATGLSYEGYEGPSRSVAYGSTADPAGASWLTQPVTVPNGQPADWGTWASSFTPTWANRPLSNAELFNYDQRSNKLTANTAANQMAVYYGTQGGNGGQRGGTFNPGPQPVTNDAMNAYSAAALDPFGTSAPGRYGTTAPTPAATTAPAAAPTPAAPVYAPNTTTSSNALPTGILAPALGPTKAQGTDAVPKSNGAADYYSNPYLNNTNSTDGGGSMGLARGGNVGAPAVGGFRPAPAVGQTPGGRVPPQASPSGGSATDDVPAALTVGEFVIPKDAAQWIGEQNLQKLILKARQEKANAGAKPDMKPSGPPGPPQFVSRPAVGMGAAA